MLDKKEKLETLLSQQENHKYSIYNLDKYVIVDDKKQHYKCALVSTDHGKRYYGFKRIEIPNPDQSAEDLLEGIVDIYGSQEVYDGFIANKTIEQQALTRKQVDGSIKFDFAKAFEMFSGTQEFLEAHKNGDSKSYLKQKWDEKFQPVSDGWPKLF